MALAREKSTKEKLLERFLFAYRYGPYEEYMVIKEELAGEDSEYWIQLIDFADEYFDAGDAMRQAMRTGDSRLIDPAEKRFEKASLALGMPIGHSDRLINEQRERVKPTSSLNRSL